MAWIAAAMLTSAAVGGYVQDRASKRAAGAQTASAEAGIEEQRRQFDAVRELLAPYVDAGTAAIAGLQPFQEAGTDALSQQRALAGLDGPEAQQAAIQMIEGSPQFEAMTRQGEQAILQSAGATGGLRGGNVQAALAQFRPQVLSGLIEQQYGRLGGLAGAGLTTTQNIMQAGQASAAGTGTAGMQSAGNIGNLLAQQGAAQAGGALASGQAWGNVFGQFGQLGGAMMTGAIPNPFGGASAGGLAPATSPRPPPNPFGRVPLA
jgi:hypothetical protein